jgi:hypothetical protein
VTGQRPRAKALPSHQGSDQEAIMKRLLVAGFLLALLAPVCAFAQSAFNGTWVTRSGSVRGMGTPTIHLDNGMYWCSCSAPPFKIKADGDYHAVNGHPGFDSEAVRVVNDHTIQVTQKKDGKITDDESVTAAPDGKTATFEFTDYTDYTGTSQVTGKGLVDRVAKDAAGSKRTGRHLEVRPLGKPV